MEGADRPDTDWVFVGGENLDEEIGVDENLSASEEGNSDQERPRRRAYYFSGALSGCSSPSYPLDVNHVDKQGRTRLMKAAFDGDYPKVERLLDSPDIKMAASCGKGYTPLHLAVFKGHFDVARLLLERGGRELLEAKTTSEKYTALHLSVLQERNGEQISPDLLVDSYKTCYPSPSDMEMRQFLNAQDRMRRTVLHYAVLRGPTIVVESLLKCPAVDINARDKDGYTPLHFAALKHRPDVVELLVAHDNVRLDTSMVEEASLRSPSIKLIRSATMTGIRRTKTALTERPRFRWYCCDLAKGGDTWVELPSPEKLTDFDDDISSGVEDGRKRFEKLSVSRCVIENQTLSEALDMLHKLVSSGATAKAAKVAGELALCLSQPIKPADEETSRVLTTAVLRLLVWIGHQGLMELLLSDPEIGKIFDFRESDIRFLFHLAVYCGHAEIAELLLRGSPLQNQGELLRSHTQDEYSALRSHTHDEHSALRSYTRDECSALRSHAQYEYSALHLAAFGGEAAMVSLLVDCYRSLTGSSQDMVDFLNDRDYMSRTPLHYAAMRNHSSVVETLLDNDAIDVNAQDIDGYTPLHFAGVTRSTDVVNLLLGHERIDLQAKATRRQETKRKEEDAHDEQGVMGLLEGSQRVGPIPQVHLNLPRYNIIYDSGVIKAAEITYRFEGGRTEVSAIRCAIVGQKDSNEDVQKVKMMNILRVVMRSDNRNPLTAEDVIKEIICILEERSPKETILHLVAGTAIEGQEETLHTLTSFPWDQRLDINATDLKGNTPLHSAVSGKCTAAVKFFLDKQGIKANAFNKDGRTPLMIALAKDYREGELLLLARPEVKEGIDNLYRDRQVVVDATNTVLVGATLIASVTYGGFLQPPLGYTPYYQFTVSAPAPPDTNPVYAALYQSNSVRVFWIFNSVSFFFAIATILSGAASVLRSRRFIGEEVLRSRRLLNLTAAQFVFSVIAVLVAFIAAGFASLPPIAKYQHYMIATTFYCIGPCLVALFIFLNPWSKPQSVTPGGWWI